MMWVLAAILFCYAIFVFYALYGWRKKSESEAVCHAEQPFVSIVIALRNEIRVIPALVKSLCALDYPQELIEIFVVDDHSTDESYEILCELTQGKSQFTIVRSPQQVQGKKQTLAWAVEHTKGDYILFTDADCCFPSTWIVGYMKEIARHKSAHFFFGLVNHSEEKTCLQTWFSLDFLAMVAMQGGLAKVHKAFSCNAANMCISREFAQKEYETNETYASGDDVFLLHKAKQVSAEHVVFVQLKEAMVTTAPPESVKQFLLQRFRWASKAGGYRDGWAVAVSLMVYLTSFAVVFAALYSLLTTHYSLLAIAFGAKTGIDLVFFAFTLPYFGKTKLLAQVVVFQLFYVFYIVLIPIFALTLPTSWKGRKIT
ncbi:MAG: glycosyltransferase [Bacteroidales bacterium]|jgi:cellulose synthase/poly-beta-1,6-N-acetylglucosamine synthase-like glycosyltransferase|nr:glycosyltransferase [Bacteroidales bacterium]